MKSYTERPLFSARKAQTYVTFGLPSPSRPCVKCILIQQWCFFFTLRALSCFSNPGGALPWWTRSMYLSIGPIFKLPLPRWPPFLLPWPILNSMTPFITFLKSWMTPLFIISFYPIAPLFLQSHITQWPTFFHCGICILVNDRLEFFKVM